MKRKFVCSLASFTLVEMLTVIAIIAILAGLTLSAFSGVMKSAARSRARAEIQAISAALENYNSDNGTYPVASTFGGTNAYTQSVSATGGGNYQLSSEILYTNLTGDVGDAFGDTPPTASSGNKIYMTFKSSQLGNYRAGGGNIYIMDPFGNSYGYYTAAPGDTTATDQPYNGQNQFDLWSTGGDIASPAVTNSWISNWGLGQ